MLWKFALVTEVALIPIFTLFRCKFFNLECAQILTTWAWAALQSLQLKLPSCVKGNKKDRARQSAGLWAQWWGRRSSLQGMLFLHRQRGRAAPSSLGASLREMLRFCFCSYLRISACLFRRIKLVHELGTCITYLKAVFVVLALCKSELETELACILVLWFWFFPFHPHLPSVGCIACRQN